jgi:hypothetical protein
VNIGIFFLSKISMSTLQKNLIPSTLELGGSSKEYRKKWARFIRLPRVDIKDI